MTRRLRIISFLAAIGCFAFAAGSYQLGFELWPPSATLADGTATPFRSADVEACVRGQVLAWLGDSYGDTYWRNCRAHLSQYQALDGFELRFWSVVGSSLFGLVALFGFALSLRMDSPSFRVIRGARLRADGRGLKAFARACAAECRIHSDGVTLVPSIPIGREREARHFLILGSVGGGKTQTMLHLIGEALARGDGLLVLDTKGDMMGGLPADGDPLFVAPHDRRSLDWDIATDCSVRQDARQLAARFIPPSSDPMWSEAAQEIFVACIVHLQATRNTDWSWADLQRIVTADIEQLATYARDHNPNALVTLRSRNRASKASNRFRSKRRTSVIPIGSIETFDWPNDRRRCYKEHTRGILQLRLGRDRLACHLVRDTAAGRISTTEDKDEDWHHRRRERRYRPR
jgi:Type IV secretion-system coupling protein DNA-binding domain